MLFQTILFCFVFVFLFICVLNFQTMLFMLSLFLLNKIMAYLNISSYFIVIPVGIPHNDFFFLAGGLASD